MGDSSPNWVWFLDQDLAETCLKAEGTASGCARRAAAHPAVVESVRRQIAGDTPGAVQALEPALAMANADALWLAGHYAFESGQFEAAAAYYAQLTAVQPGHPYASYNQAVALGRARQFTAALDALQHAVVLDPTRPQAWFVLGICLLHSRRPAEARSAFRHSLELRPAYAPAMFGEAAALQMDGNSGEAVVLYERLLDPQSGVAPAGREAILANALAAATAACDVTTCRRYAEQLHQLNPRSTSALATLAMSELDGQNHAAATHWLTALAEARPDCFEDWYNLGVALCHEGEWRRAAQAFETALQLFPEDAEALNGASHAWWEAGEPDKALAASEEWVRIAPKNSEAWFRLGLLRHAASDPKQAADAFRQALEWEPFRVEAWCNLGACHRETGEIDAAWHAYQQALACDPALPAAHHGLALLALDHRDIPLAEQHYRASATADAGIAAALAFCHQEAGNLDRARHFYEELLTLDPHCPAAHWNLGHLLLALGLPEEGSPHWRTALELDPGIAKSF